MNDMLSSDALAALARALSHPARLLILRVLAARDTCACGEIVDAMPLAQATVSQHLKVLREAGLVRGTTEGPRSCYCLDPDALAAAATAFSSFFDGLAAPPCACVPGSCSCCTGGADASVSAAAAEVSFTPIPATP